MITIKKLFLTLLLLSSIVYSQNIAPVLTATGNQIYCPQSSLPIVTNMSIIDPDDIGIQAMYVQISSGYVLGQDTLTLTGVHPTITTSWNATEGKLTLSGVSGNPTYLEFTAAIEAIVFSNTSINPNGQRVFSITVGQANYLESTDHYYQYIPNTGISWLNAKNAAASSTYYGLQGYLATITSMDEVQISGIQASGAGWIGGTDEETEGVWKWASGPEAGTIFWNGGINGSTPNFSFWNTNEPNNQGEEDYAHVTAPGVGQPGSWNDLSLTGATSGNYQPKGYIVEYGGMPGDPVLHISTTATITIPQITSFTNSSNCGNGTVTLQASANTGSVNWYANSTGGIPVFTGNTFTTPILNTTTNYYVDAFPIGCSTGTRTMITATINEIPTTSFIQPNPICQNTSTTINAASTIGTINWYASPTSSSLLFSGNSFTTPILNTTTTYYFEADNNGCLSNRTAVTIDVQPIPTVFDENISFCENTSAQLQSRISGATYLWSTGETSQNITVVAAGNYSVVITNGFGCSATKNFLATTNPIPEIDSIKVQMDGITINTTNSGNFLYSIDGTNFYSSNFFSITNGGLYSAYLKDFYDCGIDIQSFIFISTPTFFTPNNDGNNDFWFVKGTQFFPNAKTYIFDRYGKLLTTLHTNNILWDGSFNNEKMPAADYWFSTEIPETNQIIKGHFSLLR